MKVGDYVRTKDGVIAKITDIIVDFSIDCDRDVFDLNELAMMEIPWYFKDEYILKSSPNIIDLIDVGDYVNGVRVDEIKNGEIRTSSHYDGYICNLCDEEDIKSIVTHEQFSQMEYIIGD